MAHQPYTYRTSGGDQIQVTTGGVLNFASGTLTIGANTLITSGGGVTLGSLTSGDVTMPGRLTLSSGINASTAAITSGASFGGGISATTGGFSSSVSIAANLTVTSGVNASTGQFSGAVTVVGAITGSGGYREYVETATSSWSALTYNYGTSVVVGSSGGQVLLAMPAPVAGVHKYITCIDGTAGATGAAIITSSAAGATVGIGQTSILMTTGATVQQWIHLVGLNSTQWLVAGMSTDVTLSAT